MDMLQAVAADPMDKLGRLALADWHEERGEMGEAARQRVIAAALGKGWGLEVSRAGLARLRKTFPRYRKRSALLEVTTTVTLAGRYWSGGSKSTYVLVRDGKVSVFLDIDPFRGNDRETTRLNKGEIIVRGGTFCGKEATMVVHVHPDDVPCWVG
jgi:uncharacterized protein (TIGR02996 family)